MLPENTRTRQLNGTCTSSVDMELFLHYSLIPSLFIILILSFLQRREHRRQRDDTSYLLGNRFGIIMPLDFVGTFSNRWSYGIAFGATANKVMFLFSEGYQPLQIPQWAQAFELLIGGIEVGLSHFPFFACLSSEFQLVSSILGFCYSLIWFAVTVLQVSQCPHGQFVGKYETLMFYWPSLLCLAFLLGRFLHMFVKALRVHLGWEFQVEEKSVLETHQAEHVKQLLRTPRPQEKKKSWFQTRIYEWDPCFQFPSRMIGTIVLAFICLYLFIVIEFCVFVYVRDELEVFENKLESYITFTNHSGVLTPVILQVKELISITKGVWVATILPASLTCVSYLFHILVCYRKHIKRLWAGDKHFLPLKFHNPASSASVVAIARYSGWQIAYILWGYLIIHVVQSLCGMAIMYGLVLPIVHNQGLEMLQGLGIGILTISIVVGLMILQMWIAASFFLQPKLGTADKQKPLALNNRKAFHNFNYFLFFYNVLLGLGACLSRLLISCLLGTWLIARIDRTIMQNGYEGADMGFSAWIGMLYVDHYHTNPVLVSFCHILIANHKEKKLQQTTKYWCLNQSAGPRVSARSRIRWFLLQTLINNPRLIIHRKLKSGHSSQESQILMPCLES
ncbi:stimulated by retinoic acid gene 6 protein-like isoform X1 [Chlorocebus sabaeus]|uniref:stimulated by retinoic acid gene 6 protein-like isoform X1 n=1 Tax=Chlorocebus sabaeus TaxID=60711 RepID=UPI0018B05902|nr:stimulated by retinoic acid gene 6 protein-like isoform X1 [Chlorocebus sabaeus]XP_037854151.1 stimulated by retinoic acid gene 6 protein-like isoform X1 [Chlorocebus sabaeus]XP_037854152.1 stimulated by retinoic acid gene 6 protein-like isoform X1 [Chlorocebus sabaeus]XP_037854153.1 stimulated by retinoic acid gene 6 protein-like isoform X1 [Chlorocebus sabaeus]XP_037854154.1 stimulated by retinoic acid gene 6 protein-like isoform X1 [Chlorocebus sabaeus]XP_037854155.1 stimulated by retino